MQQSEQDKIRFKSAKFRQSVKTVLEHFGYEPTFRAYLAHGVAGNLTSMAHWHDSAEIIQNPSPNIDKTGVYFVSHTGVEIEMGKCLNSVRELIEYNNKRSK
jgi:hypothetical protein